MGISYAATVAFLYLHAHPLVPVVTSSPWFVLASATKGPPEKDEDKAKDEDEVVDRVIDLSKENPTGKRVADYFRVSTTKQGEGLSLKAQEEELLSWNERYHPSKVYTYVDNGKSGKKFTNRKIKEITELKEKGLIDEVWVRAVDRLGRDCYDLARFFVSFMLAGGVIRTATETFTKEPVSLINFILQAFAAEIQNKARTDAIAGSFRKSIRDGKYPLVAPLGYEKTEDDRIVKTSDPKLRAACQDVAPTFLLSQTKTFVETSSNIERVHGIKFRPPVIRNMLTSPFYEGKIGLCGEVQYNPSLAYRSEEETAQIARILADKGARYARKADEIFQVQVFSDVGNVYEFMRKLHEHYVIRGCKGYLGPNGVRPDAQPPHLGFYCSVCGMGFRMPRTPPAGCQVPRSPMPTNGSPLSVDPKCDSAPSAGIDSGTGPLGGARTFAVGTIEVSLDEI